VERLALLHRAVKEGRSISQVAAMRTEELRELVREDQVERRTPAPPEPLDGTSAGRVLGPAHEHVATVVIRRFLEWVLGIIEVSDGAPVMVAGTPAGEKHELGALLCALSGAAEGWRGVFLGPDLPSEEVASAALRLEAKVVTLSCVDPRTAQALPGELMRIRELLPTDVHLMVGGPLTVERDVAFFGEGVEIVRTLDELRERLRLGVSMGSGPAIALAGAGPEAQPDGAS
jgi:methylmalonyl-CoA mutase cobalamin-binding subunit